MGRGELIDPSKENFLILVLFAVAAISGGLGGCASALASAMRENKSASVAFVFAYIILGVVFGIVTLSVLTFYDHGPTSINDLILFSTAGGAAGSIGLASANWSIRAAFRKFGVDVQLTVRRMEDERRSDKVDN
jgi:hypothetical protein